MVVNGLDEYISIKCKQCVKTTPICPKPGTRYVIDGCSFVSHIIRQTSWIFGGQWKEIKDAVEKFVIGLLGEGCDATFIMPHWADALTPTDSQNIKMGLEFVSINQRLPGLDFYQNPPAAYFLIAQFLRACRVETLCSVNDFEFEVAAWAKLKCCTGVISNNNEFVALDGVPFYRLSSLNTELHTIEHIDRFLLMKNLGLRTNHLPLLSCMLGNSLIPPQLLQYFHKKLQSGMHLSGSNPVLDIMPRICMYVRPQNTQYNMLARTALGSEAQAPFLQAIINRYSLSEVTETWRPDKPVEGNLVTYNSTQIYEDAVRKQINCESIPFIYGVLTSFSYEEGVTLEHLPLTSSFDLYRPLRKSCYNIVLGCDASVTEKCISKKLEIETVQCDKFDIKNETVKLDLLADNDNTPLRWAAFVKCAKVTFNETLARQLPSQYLGLCCILNYWWHSPLIHISQWELNAMLAQAVSQYCTDVASLRRVLVTVVNTRAITLASMLARGAEALLQIAAAVCLPTDPLLPHHYFDGKLFSFYYYLSDKGTDIDNLCDNFADRIEMFKFLMMVIQSENLDLDEDQEEPNISIVPEYEAISDEEEDEKEESEKGDFDPVSDEELPGVLNEPLVPDVLAEPTVTTPAVNDSADKLTPSSSQDMPLYSTTTRVPINMMAVGFNDNALHVPNTAQVNALSRTSDMHSLTEIEKPALNGSSAAKQHAVNSSSATSMEDVLSLCSPEGTSPINVITTYGLSKINMPNTADPRNSILDNIMRLQMTSPDHLKTNDGCHFPSFPSVNLNTNIAMGISSQRSMFPSFPNSSAAGNTGQEKVHEGCKVSGVPNGNNLIDLAPQTNMSDHTVLPSFLTKSDSLNIAPLQAPDTGVFPVFPPFTALVRPTIPLPPLPGPLPLFPMLSDHASTPQGSKSELPLREKQHSDKENCSANKKPFTQQTTYNIAPVAQQYAGVSYQTTYNTYDQQSEIRYNSYYGCQHSVKRRKSEESPQ